MPLIDYVAPDPSNLLMLSSDTGSSCGTGDEGSPNINHGATTTSATSCFTNLMPAYAQWRPVATTGGAFYAGEAPELAMGRVLNTLTGSSLPSAPYMMAANGFGVAGAAYSVIAQTTSPYVTMQHGFTKEQTLLGANYALNVPATEFVHGEADAIAGTSRATYASDIETLETNLTTDLEAITSQSNTPLLLITQETNNTQFASIANSQAIIGAQWDAQVANPTTIFIATPMYVLESNNIGITGSPGHLSSRGYFEMGEYMARAYHADVPIAQGGLGGSFTAPEPTTGSISNSGATVTIPFTGGTAPYKLDCSYVTSPNGAADGFYYTDTSGSPPSIVSVAANGSNIVLTLSGAPSHAVTATVEYAWSTTNGEGTSAPGPKTGLRGCMHDSDSYVSILDKTPLPNYSIAWNATFTTN